MNELIECQRDDRLALSSSDYIITMMKIIMQTSPGSPLRMTRQNTALSLFEGVLLLGGSWKSYFTKKLFVWKVLIEEELTNTFVQTPPGASLRGWRPLPGRVPRPGDRGGGAQLLHGEGLGHHQQAGDRQRARPARHPGLGEFPWYIRASVIDLATLRFLRISHSRGNFCPCRRPGCGFRWSMSSGAAWGSRRRSTPGLRSSSSSHPTRSWWTTSAPRDTNWIRWGGGG